MTINPYALISCINTLKMHGAVAVLLSYIGCGVSVCRDHRLGSAQQLRRRRPLKKVSDMADSRSGTVCEGGKLHRTENAGMYAALMQQRIIHTAANRIGK